MPKSKRSNLIRPRPHRFALEARQLFDGAAVTEATHHNDTVPDTHHDTAAVDLARTVTLATPSKAEASAKSADVYVVDTHIDHWQSLVAQLPSTARVIVIDQSSSGLDQLNNALKDEHNIAAIHILSHGASDEITLGSDRITAGNLAQYSQQMNTLGQSMTADGDILFYGCSIAADDKLLIKGIATLTQADVAASTDRTGNALAGGNWALEASTGVIESRTLALEYDRLLETPTVKTTSTELVVAEPTSLLPVSSAQFSGWTVSAEDQVSIDVRLQDISAGLLNSSQESSTNLSFLGTASEAQAWLNSLSFTATGKDAEGAAYEQGNSDRKTEINVYIFDSNGFSFSTVNVTITPSNDRATVNDASLDVTENNGNGTVITAATLAALDPELSVGAQTPTQMIYSLTALPQYGYLTLNGTRLGAGSVFSQQDVNNGSLRYVHTATGNMQNASDSFNVRINDGSTPLASSDSATITLNILPENQPPTVSGSGIVFEGQPQNADKTGNVGQYIIASTGGDPQDADLTLTINTLPGHGTLYFNNIAVVAGQQILYSQRAQLTYSNDGQEGITQDSFDITVTDQGGGTATSASTRATITLHVESVNDDPTLTPGATLEAQVVPGPAAVTLTPEMLSATDPDSSAGRISFIVDTRNLLHGYLTLNNQRLQSGDTFTVNDIINGRVKYIQYQNAAFDGQQDLLDFKVIDHATALRWNSDGTTFTRPGGIWEGPAENDILQSFTFAFTLASNANNNLRPDQVPLHNVSAQTTSSGYIGTDGSTGTGAPHGTLNEGGSIVLAGTGNITDNTPGMSYVVNGIAPDEIVYTWLGTNSGENGLTVIKRDAAGGITILDPFSNFTQADLNAGLIEIIHDGGETFSFTAHFSVSAGQVQLDSNGNPVAVTWDPALRVTVTPVNDAPVVQGGGNLVIAEGETVAITTGQLTISDPDDADSGTAWEGAVQLNGNNNYAFNNDASGAGAMKIVFQSLPAGGHLEYLDGSNWKVITAADIGMLKLDAGILKSDGSSGLRFVSNGSEVRSTQFSVSVVDRWGQASVSAATVNIIMTSVNDGPAIAPADTAADPIVPADSPNMAGGAPENNPLVVKEGGYAKIDSTFLQAWDPDSTAEQVQYTLNSNTRHGHIVRSTDGVNFVTLGAGSSFTQADINSGYIWYVSDGSDVNGNGLSADSFSFTLSDGDKEQSGNTFSIDVTPANDAPIVTAPNGPVQVGGNQQSVGGFVIADPDLSGSATNVSDILQTTVRLLHANGTAFSASEYSDVLLNIASGSGVIASGGSQSVLVLTGTLAQMNAALAGLTVNFSTDRNDIYQIQVITDDRLRNSDGTLNGSANGGPVNQPTTPTLGNAPGPVDSTNYNWYQDTVPANNGNIAAAALTILASQIDDPGTLSVGQSGKTVYEDQRTFIGGDFTLSDIESAAFGLPVTLTLTVTHGTLGIGGTDSDSDVNGVTIVGDNTGTLVLTGTASAIQALINDRSNGLTWLSEPDTNHDQNGSAAGDVTLTVSLNTSASGIGNASGTAPADVSVALLVVPVNDAPTITADPTIVQLNNSVAGGSNVGGFVVSDIDITDSGGIASGETDVITVTVRITDASGNPFAVGQYRDQANSSITITSGNTASGVTIESISRDGTNPPANGQNAPLVMTGTLAQVNAYLAQLQVTLRGIALDDSDEYYRVEVIADDRVRDTNGLLTQRANGGDNPAANNSGTEAVPLTEIDPYASIPTGLEKNVTSATRTVFQSAVNDAAQINLGANPGLSVDENSATVTLPKITVSDVDSGSNRVSVTVTLPAGFTFANNSNVLTLSGSVSEINTALAAMKVTLPDAAGDATRADWNGNFNVIVQVNDNANSGSRPATLPVNSDPALDPGKVEYADSTSAALITTREFTFTVNPVNDAPRVTGSTSVTLPAIAEDSPASAINGDTVGNLFASRFDDQKDTISGGSQADVFHGVAVTRLSVNAAQGEWQFSTDGGASWLAVGNRSDNNALILDASALLRFVPAANFFGTPAALGVRLVETNDNNDISSTAAVPVSGSTLALGNDHGGTSRYSDAVIILSTLITNVNDRPTLGDRSVTVSEDSRTAQTAGALFQSQYSDQADNQSSVSGGGNASADLTYIAIYGNTVDASKGHWEYSTNGTNWSVLPADISPDNALALSSSTLMRFVPLADYNGPVSGSLQLRATDSSLAQETGINVNNRVDFYTYARDNDPTSHWSNTAQLTVSVTPVVDAFNDSFVIHANNPLVKTAADLLANDHFSNPDHAITGVTPPANGTLTFSNGVYTYQPASGFVGTDSYTYTVTSGGVTETATVNITVTNIAPVSVNDSVVINEDGRATGNVLTNDVDADGDTLRVKQFTVDGQTYAPGMLVTLSGNRGTLQINNDGTYTFTPVGDWYGALAVTYVATDGNQGGDSSSQLTLQVKSVRDATDDVGTAHLDQIISTDVLANDTFSNADKTITAFTQPDNGTVTRSGNRLIYTPDNGFVGNDAYTYTVVSGGKTETATVYLMITNTPPDASNQFADTPEDTPLAGNVLRTLLDPDGDEIRVVNFEVTGITGQFSPGSLVSLPGMGSFILSANGDYQFIPVPDWNGKLPTISFNVADNSGQFTNSTLDITVQPVVDIVNDTVSTHAGQAITLTPLANDHFSNSNAVITGTGTPLHGTVSLVNNQLVYTPTAGFVGTDTFSYTVTSGGVTEKATVTVNVTNIVPVISPVYATTTEDIPILANLLDNARDGDNDALTVQSFTLQGVTYDFGTGDTLSVDMPAFGRLTISSSGLYIFTPVADWNGAVPVINFTISDGNQGGTAQTQLVITVSPVVDIQPDIATTHADNAVIINVLSNDTFENSTQTVTAQQDATTQGRLDVLSDGTIRYSPPAGFVGTDSFTYTVTSGGVSETSTVTVLVTNQSPISGDTVVVMYEDGAVPLNTLVMSDPDGDVLRVTGFKVGNDFIPVANFNTGTFDIPNVGTITIGYDRSFTFTQVPDWNGIVPEITWTATDDNGSPATEISGKLKIIVLPITDIASDSITLHAGGSNTFDAMANDRFESSTATVTSVTDGQHGKVTLGSDGQLTYTPDPFYVGNDSYTYTVTSGVIKETATVYVTVNNLAPQANPDVASEAEDTQVRGNVLTNDSDDDNTPVVQDTLRVTTYNLAGESRPHQAGETVEISGIGSLTLNADGSYLFIPVADWNGSVPLVTYTLSDGHDGGTSSSTLSISLSAQTDITPDSVTTHAGQPVVIDALSNDNFDNPDRQITATSNGVNGGVTIVDGKIIYRPQQGFVGVDSFTYTVTSGGVRETSTVTVSITNQTPVLMPDTAVSEEDHPATGNVLTNDSDPEGDKLSVAGFVVTGDNTLYQAGATAVLAGKGTFMLSAEGNWTFTPVKDWNGTLPLITYGVTDGNSNGSVISTLAITISPVQDAFDDTVFTHGGDAVLSNVLGNDTFSNSDRTIISITQGQNGTVSLENGQIRYTPWVGFIGTDSYFYTVRSGGIEETAQVNVVVMNERPLPQPDENITAEDTLVSGNVLQNDSDPDGDPLLLTQYSVAGQTAPAGYPVQINGVGTLVMHADGSYTLQTVADWNGQVPVITYTVSDGFPGGTHTATLNITLSPVADVRADFVTTHAGQAVSADVLSNDTFSNPDAQITQVSQGENGRTQLIDGQIIYTPRAGFVGEDRYTYTVLSGGVTETSTVNVQVTNSVPVVNSEGVITPQETAISGNVLANDHDPDGDPIHVAKWQVAGKSYTTGETAVITGMGQLQILTDGSYHFTPQGNWHGFVPLVTYTVSDSNENGNRDGTLRILVSPSVDIVVKESGLTPQDPGSHQVTGTLDVLSLASLQNLTFNGVTFTAEQLRELSNNTPVSVTTATGTLQLLGYHLRAEGQATLDYRFTLQRPLSQPDSSETREQVILTINGSAAGVINLRVIDDVPQAEDNRSNILQDQGQDSANGNLFDNDRMGADGAGPDGPITGVYSQNTAAPGAIDGVTRGEFGSLRLDKNGNWVYQVDKGNPRVASLEANAYLSEVFIYTMTDADGDTSEASLTIVINGVTAIPNVSREGNAHFSDRHYPAYQPYRTDFEPGLFILPMIYDLQSAEVAREIRQDSRMAAYGYGIEHANAPVMEQAVLFTRWFTSTRNFQETPTLQAHGLGQNLMWDAFSPFSMSKVEERERLIPKPIPAERQHAEPAIEATAPVNSASVVKPQGEAHLHHPEPLKSAPGLTAQLAAMDKATPGIQHITIPGVVRP